jgi:hypothetical protein
LSLILGNDVTPQFLNHIDNRQIVKMSLTWTVWMTSGKHQTSLSHESLNSNQIVLCDNKWILFTFAALNDWYALPTYVQGIIWTLRRECLHNLRVVGGGANKVVCMLLLCQFPMLPSLLVWSLFVTPEDGTTGQRHHVENTLSVARVALMCT